MMTAVSTQELAENLKQRVQSDNQFDDQNKLQINGLVDTIVKSLTPYPDLPKDIRKDVPKDADYSKHISSLWFNISTNDTIQPSTKRSALYAIEQLQKLLWRK